LFCCFLALDFPWNIRLNPAVRNENIAAVPKFLSDEKAAQAMPMSLQKMAVKKVYSSACSKKIKSHFLQQIEKQTHEIMAVAKKSSIDIARPAEMQMKITKRKGMPKDLKREFAAINLLPGRSIKGGTHIFNV
jgi:hypothetical protein